VETVSKGEFAGIIGVSAGRISQMIAEGKIGPDALEGVGRNAKVRVELARQQIAERTDLGQRFGNGLLTRLETPPAPDKPSAPADPVAEQIKRERLLQIQHANRKAAEEALERAGQYVRADQVGAAMGKLGAALINVFEGGLGDLAQSIAAKFALPPRDVLHLLRSEFRSIREKGADAVRRQAASAPALIGETVADATDPALGEA
jgi:hypothetical protein